MCHVQQELSRIANYSLVQFVGPNKKKVIEPEHKLFLINIPSTCVASRRSKNLSLAVFNLNKQDN